jgi:hypothetical protein
MNVYYIIYIFFYVYCTFVLRNIKPIHSLVVRCDLEIRQIKRFSPLHARNVLGLI